MSGPASTTTSRQTIVLGVTGGIGAYKACELVRMFVRRDCCVKVVMTEAATRFVAPLTFRTLTGEPVATSLWEDAPGDPVHHVSLAQEADIMVIAPCTANVIAKLAHGRADDMLTTTALATEAPLVLAPAMNDRMWLSDSTQQNIDTLRERGVVLVGPAVGELACGDEGVGRLAEAGEITETVIREAERVRSLDDVRMLVTAGGTREPLDPVRFLGNRSSGKTGFSVAEEAARRGADVVVIAGAVSVPDPFGCSTVHVENAQEMRDAVMERVGDADVLVMTAAVADYKPIKPADSKIKKSEGLLSIELERTPDILAEVGALMGERLLIGFAAETEDVIENARRKLSKKGVDLIVANDVSREGLGFASDDNQVVFVTADEVHETPVLGKKEIAGMLLDHVTGMLGRRKEA